MVSFPALRFIGTWSASNEQHEPLLVNIKATAVKRDSAQIRALDASSIGTSSLSSCSSSLSLASHPSLSCTTVSTILSTTSQTRKKLVAARWITNGNAHFGRGDMVLAKEAYLRSIDSCCVHEKVLEHGNEEKEDDSLLEEQLECLAEAYSNLATVYWKSNDISRSMNLFQQSLLAHEQYLQLVGLVPIGGSATEHLRRGRVAVVQESHMEFIQAMAAVYHQLGLGYALKHQYKHAHDALKGAYTLRLFVHGSNPHKQVACSLKALGNVSFMQKDYDSALDYYEESFAMNCLLGNTNVSDAMIHSMTRISDTYRAKGESSSALFGYQVVLSMQSEMLLVHKAHDCKQTLRKSMGETWTQIGDLLSKKGSHQKALEAYRNANYFFVAARVSQHDQSRKETEEKLNLVSEKIEFKNTRSQTIY